MINNSRSMNADLREGATDGTYKSLSPDRGGAVETAFLSHRAGELPVEFYGSIVSKYDYEPLGPAVPKGTA